ncbi:MAG: transposase [Methanothermobacter sp.]|nr:transposase [Methanothermobacter sp.]
MFGYKFRLYPSKTIETKLIGHLDLCRCLYNRLLQELNEARAEGRKLTFYDTQKLIVRLKNEENPELKKVHSKVLQMVNRQLWNNIRALSRLKKNGRKVGKLRFKGKWYKTMNYNQSGFKIEENKLILSKIGTVNIKLHRQIKGKIKGVIIKRESSGKWFAVLQVEDKPEPLPKTEKATGIGIKHFLTDSKGRQIENPKFYEKTLKKIKILQRDLSRKKRGSKNRERARIKLARAYEKLKNQRDDFLHKLSKFYIK